MPWIAQVALLSAAIDKSLTYLIPPTLQPQVQVGCAVAVPLQRRMTSGIVLSVHESPASQNNLKPIASLLDPLPVLDAQRLALAAWISAEYYSPFGRCCALMVPPGFTPKSQQVYSLADDRASVSSLASSQLATVRMRILAALQLRGAVTEARLKTILKDARGWRMDLQRLLDEGMVLRSSTLQPPKVQPRKSTLVQLVVSDTTLEIVLGNLRQDVEKQPRRAMALARRMAVLEYLRAHSGIAWAEWILAETGASRVDLSWLAEQGYALLGDAERWRDPLSDMDYVVKTPPPLTQDQAQVWEVIQLRMQQIELRIENEELRKQPDESFSQFSILNSPFFLLRGVTGSGKTEIYMRAVERALQQGKGAIVLVPEISLTPQTSRRFLERFPGKVALIHSKLKPGERFDTWRRIRSGELGVVVGARSALFAPIPKLGLIVLDEEHDSSYKQTSQPAYDARRVAEHYAKQVGATLILGSATPSLEAMWQAGVGREDRTTLKATTPAPTLTFLELPNRVRGHVNRIGDQQARLGIASSHINETETVAYQPLPNVQLIDMRQELHSGNTGMFSNALREALAETLHRGEQAIFFLNRRGAASCVVCRDCGHAMRCPNDDVPLTLHTASVERGDGGRGGSPPSSLLLCHQCNHSERLPTHCPVCRSPRIRPIGIGTQKVEQTIQALFPKARVVRWDKDASMGADNLLQRFVQRQADVLVGTQMIAKGLDLPLVTLVGVVLADVGLFLPDFRANERVFNLLEQVAGRAGRGLLPGRVIVQSYNPEHPAIQYAVQHNVKGFVHYELGHREMLNLPPYTRLVRFEVLHEHEDTARAIATELAKELRWRVEKADDVIGPAQAYFARRNKRYRWQVIVRTHAPNELLKGLAVPLHTTVDVDPVSVL